jgi:hypothetical protein
MARSRGRREALGLGFARQRFAAITGQLFE